MNEQVRTFPKQSLVVALHQSKLLQDTYMKEKLLPRLLQKFENHAGLYYDGVFLATMMVFDDFLQDLSMKAFQHAAVQLILMQGSKDLVDRIWAAGNALG